MEFDFDATGWYTVHRVSRHREDAAGEEKLHYQMLDSVAAFVAGPRDRGWIEDAEWARAESG